jgi:hypothetical protein
MHHVWQQIQKYKIGYSKLAGLIVATILVVAALGFDFVAPLFLYS